MSNRGRISGNRNFREFPGIGLPENITTCNCFIKLLLGISGNETPIPGKSAFCNILESLAFNFRKFLPLKGGGMLPENGSIPPPPDLFGAVAEAPKATFTPGWASQVIECL